MLRQPFAREIYSLPFFGDERVKVTYDIRRVHLARLDVLKEQWGLPSRAAALQRLLDVCFLGDISLDQCH